MKFEDLRRGMRVEIRSFDSKIEAWYPGRVVGFSPGRTRVHVDYDGDVPYGLALTKSDVKTRLRLPPAK